MGRVLIGVLRGAGYKERRAVRVMVYHTSSLGSSKNNRRMQWQFQNILNKLTTRGRVA
jgi:hypothetical protein